MQQALADFRIESDRVVLLSFRDGRRYRVSPSDLEHCLQQDDLRRVRKALRLRHQFVRRILPPSAVVLVVVGIAGFGSYDMYRVSQGWPVASPVVQESQQQVTSQSPTTPAPSTAGAVPPIKAPSNTIAPTAGAGTSDKHPRKLTPSQDQSNSAVTTRGHTGAEGDLHQPISLPTRNVNPVTKSLRKLPIVKEMGR